MFSYLTDKPVDIDALFAGVHHPHAGAVLEQTGDPAKHIYEFDANK